MDNPFLAERWLATRHLGRPLRVFAEIDSTNTEALRHADDAAQHGLTLLAHAQAAGRGQYGRSWLAPPKSSVLMSALLFPPAPLRRPVLLTSWAAVAVCDLLGEITGRAARIKWPNDVYLDDKKASGILIEQRTTSDREHPVATVVGIGLNVTQSAADFAAAGLPLGGSLFSLTGERHDSETIAVRLIDHLDRWYERLASGDIASLQSPWAAHLDLVGHEVRVDRNDRTSEGRLLELTFDGVLLATSNGLLECIPPETIRHLTRCAS